MLQIYLSFLNSLQWWRNLSTFEKFLLPCLLFHFLILFFCNRICLSNHQTSFRKFRLMIIFVLCWSTTKKVVDIILRSRIFNRSIFSIIQIFILWFLSKKSLLLVLMNIFIYLYALIQTAVIRIPISIKPSIRTPAFIIRIQLILLNWATQCKDIVRSSLLILHLWRPLMIWHKSDIISIIYQLSQLCLMFLDELFVLVDCFGYGISELILVLLIIYGSIKLK